MKSIKTLIQIGGIAMMCGASFAMMSCGEPVYDEDHTISICASEIPHAQLLNGCVKGLLAKQGYGLKVTVLDWSEQNAATADGDYDANYFQHITYLGASGYGETLAATAKVHYEPLSIYRAKSTGTLAEGRSFEICDDTSNAIRAFLLLQANGVLNTIPVNEDQSALTFTGTSWTSDSGITITLISEETLVQSMDDYDFAVLPGNTAYTGHVNTELIAQENDPALKAFRANLIAVRRADYLAGGVYKTKIDKLTDAVLTPDVSSFFTSTYKGAMVADSDTQIDLRSEIK